MTSKRARRGVAVGALPIVLVALAGAGLSQELPGAKALSGRDLLGDLARAPAGNYHRVSSSHADNDSNLDYMPLAAGAELTLANLRGCGVIRHLWLMVESDDPYYSRLIVLRARWDGETSPSIDVPIGDFFAVGNAVEVPVDTLPVRVAGDGRGRSCWWPMPFNDGAQISLRNDSGRPAPRVWWEIDWSDVPAGGGARTLHASFRASPRNPSLRQHKVAEIDGAGHYVGTVVSIWSGESGWPGEGDDRYFVDGAENPSFRGIGFESAFDDAWGFRVGTGPFGGVTAFEGTGSGARTTACRWFLNDPIPFSKGLTVTFERMGYAVRNQVVKVVGDRRDAWSSVAFWYQQEPHVIFPALPSQNERLPFDEIRIEPEEKELFETIEVAEGAPPPTVHADALLAYGRQVRFEPVDLQAATLSIPIELSNPREYDLYARLTSGPDGGCWEMRVDGERVGTPVDLCSPRAISTDRLFGSVKLARGAHSIELHCVGHRVESTGYALGLDSVMLRWYP